MKLTHVLEKQLMNMRDILRGNGHVLEAKLVDDVVSNFYYKNIKLKQEQLKYISTMCHIKAFGDLYVREMSLNKWLDFLSNVKKEAEVNQIILQKEIETIPLENCVNYYGRQISLDENVFDWAVCGDITVLNMNDNEGKFFRDNLAAFIPDGTIHWSTKDKIDVKDRDGAVFTGLWKKDNDIISAYAYVGINYTFDVRTGNVIKKVITK